uniref:Uncharacterized protein n=1 Tax=Oryza brachyantha TaxID=4533 RepID=J3LHR0_ORYBR
VTVATGKRASRAKFKRIARISRNNLYLLLRQLTDFSSPLPPPRREFSSSSSSSSSSPRFPRSKFLFEKLHGSRFEHRGRSTRPGGGDFRGGGVAARRLRRWLGGGNALPQASGRAFRVPAGGG